MLQISCFGFIPSNEYNLRRTPEWHGDPSNFMLSNELCVMEWRKYPFESLPTSFQSDNLVELMIPCSRIKQLWDGWKSFEKLKRIGLSHSQNLIETPDISGVPNLEELDLAWCRSLCMVHPSIGFLRRLKRLSLQCFEHLKRLPDVISLESLEYLNLSGCSRLNKFPDIVGNITSLRELYLDRTAIKKIPLSFKSMSSLKYLDISGVSIFEEVPSSTVFLKKLNTLIVEGRKLLLGSGSDPISILIPNSFSGLSSLRALDVSYRNQSDGAMPSDLSCLSSLKYLYLSGNKFTRIPDSVGQLSNLQSLFLANCNKLQLSSNPNNSLLHNSFSGLSSLQILDLSYCDLLDGAIPNDLSCLSSLRSLNLSGNKFTRIPHSVAELSQLCMLDLEDRSWLQVLSKLPLGLEKLRVKNCPSLRFFITKWTSGLPLIGLLWPLILIMMANPARSYICIHKVLYGLRAM